MTGAEHFTTFWFIKQNSNSLFPKATFFDGTYLDGALCNLNETPLTEEFSPTTPCNPISEEVACNPLSEGLHTTPCKLPFWVAVYKLNASSLQRESHLTIMKTTFQKGLHTTLLQIPFRGCYMYEAHFRGWCMEPSSTGVYATTIQPPFQRGSPSATPTRGDCMYPLYNPPFRVCCAPSPCNHPFREVCIQPPYHSHSTLYWELWCNPMKPFRYSERFCRRGVISLHVTPF